MGSKHTLYTCEIIFHRAEHVPIGDLNNFSCDPYIHATLEVPNIRPDYPRPPLVYRTSTIRRTLNPIYNARWIVSGIPDSGFTLTLRLLDEDPGDHDDRLGKVIMRLPDPMSGQRLQEGWDTGETEYKVEKKKGSIRSHAATYIAAMVTRGRISHHARIWVSVRVTGKARDQQDRRIFTVGPPKYTRHFSPLIGHLVSAGTAANEPTARGKNNKPLAASTFVANRLQLTGPPPRSLRHRYVGYAPFIKWLFKRKGIRGKVLHYALHRQYNTLYGYDKSTVYGVAGEGEVDTDGSKARAMKKAQVISQENGDASHDRNHDSVEGQTEGRAQDVPANHLLPKQTTTEGKSHPEALSREFLCMTSHGTAGRLFTYVITLDSEWRFTETGEEFSVDMLSKHSMHANVAKEIAFSGEFFVRRIRHADQADGQEAQDKDEHRDEAEVVSDDLKDYELVIDNDSGTYRPKKELLPKLQKWLEQEENLGAMGKVTAMDGFDETLKTWKEERREEKRRAKGLKPRPKTDADGKAKGKPDGNEGQDNDGQLGKMTVPKKGSSLSSVDRGRLGSRASSLSSSDVEAVLREDAKRARENQDDDLSALDEERQAGKGTENGVARGKTT